VAITFVVYAPAVRDGFVFDDRALITDNPMIHARDGLYRFWFTSESPDYRPVIWSLWWLEWRAWGANPVGYHVVNVLLHAVNAVLVWVVLRRLKIPGAWLAALVFAVHPVNVATVAWISEQKNTLSMLFYALSILFYLRFDDDGRWRWYGWSVAAFLLALLSKTAIVMLPVVLLGCVWWRRGRIPKRDWLCSVPYLAASLALAVVTIVQHQRALGDVVVRTGGFASRLAAAGWIPWFYLSKALLPVGLTVVYPKWEIDVSRWTSYVPGVMLIGGLAVFWWRRKSWGRPWLFGLGYFVVMLFPVLGFFDQGFYYYSLVADHWQYYSIVGVIALVVGAGKRMSDRFGERGRTVGVVAGVALSLALGAAAWRRGSVYTNEETLWRDNVNKNPGAWMAHNNLANVLLAHGQAAEAIAHYQETIRLRPDYGNAHYNLGIASFQRGDYNTAVVQFREAVRLKPRSAEAYNNLGAALAKAGQTNDAIAQLKIAARLAPHWDEPRANLARLR